LNSVAKKQKTERKAIKLLLTYLQIIVRGINIIIISKTL